MYTPKRHSFVLSILLLAGLLMSCVPPAATPTPTPAETPTPAATPTPVPSPTPFKPISEVEFTSVALADNLLNEPATRKFLIYLPPSYPTSDKHYPVVYALHEYKENHWTMSTLMNKIDEMIQNGEAPEMIVVMPDASNVFRGSFYMSSPTIGDYQTYIAQELVEWIDSHYRTLAQPDSRGITGCSMGGQGAMILGMTYPDVFGVAAGVSGTYLLENEKMLGTALATIRSIPQTFPEFRSAHWKVQTLFALAAATASNPENPPFFLDMPFVEKDGEIHLDEAVVEKFRAAYAETAVAGYLAQTARLQGIMIYHGEWDSLAPVEGARAFSALLTDKGVPHEYLEVKQRYFCGYDLEYEPVVQFMADHLHTEETE